jgi:hypothetical protein
MAPIYRFKDNLERLKTKSLAAGPTQPAPKRFKVTMNEFCGVNHDGSLDSEVFALVGKLLQGPELRTLFEDVCGIDCSGGGKKRIVYFTDSSSLCFDSIWGQVSMTAEQLQRKRQLQPPNGSYSRSSSAAPQEAQSQVQSSSGGTVVVPVWHGETTARLNTSHEAGVQLQSEQQGSEVDDNQRYTGRGTDARDPARVAQSTEALHAAAAAAVMRPDDPGTAPGNAAQAPQLVAAPQVAAAAPHMAPGADGAVHAQAVPTAWQRYQTEFSPAEQDCIFRRLVERNSEFIGTTSQKQQILHVRAPNNGNKATFVKVPSLRREAQTLENVRKGGGGGVIMRCFLLTTKHDLSSTAIATKRKAYNRSEKTIAAVTATQQASAPLPGPSHQRRSDITQSISNPATYRYMKILSCPSSSQKVSRTCKGELSHSRASSGGDAQVTNTKGTLKCSAESAEPLFRRDTPTTNQISPIGAVHDEARPEVKAFQPSFACLRVVPNS